MNNISKGALEDDPHKNEKESEDPERVLSNLKGHVRLKNGTARFANLSFSVPGAMAKMQGTYDLITEKIDLHGTLRTDSEPSDTIHGVKSLMLKALDPFFKKKHVGYETPVKITGTYTHPVFGLDLGHDDKKRAKQMGPAKL